MAGKKADLGPIGIELTHNVRRLRGNLSYAELSRRLEDMHREIPPLGLRRIEAGTRRVDADDLVALAVALGVSPITLLMPAADKRSEQVAVTGVDAPVPAGALWEWLQAGCALPSMHMETMEFGLRAWSKWEKEDAAEIYREAKGQGVKFRGDDQ